MSTSNIKPVSLMIDPETDHTVEAIAKAKRWTKKVTADEAVKALIATDPDLAHLRPKPAPVQHPVES